MVRLKALYLGPSLASLIRPVTVPLQAQFRIRPGIKRTQLNRSIKMSRLLDADVYFKNEFEHPTGSFKERGARNALLLLGVFEESEESAAHPFARPLQCAFLHATACDSPL
jgi:threonine dehydratase